MMNSRDSAGTSSGKDLLQPTSGDRRPRPLVQAVTFAACYVYSPGGSGVACECSRLLRFFLKASDERFIMKYAVRVRQEFADAAQFAGFFHPADVLVPVPSSSPTTPHKVTVTLHLANALKDEGLGRHVWTGLQRIRAVQKSATAAPGARPTVANHYDSFSVQPPSETPADIMLIDDVVTKGRTLLAAASRLREAFPSARIRAFALVRTMGLTPAVEKLLQPCVGEIRWRAGDAHRNP